MNIIQKYDLVSIFILSFKSVVGLTNKLNFTLMLFFHAFRDKNIAILDGLREDIKI